MDGEVDVARLYRRRFSERDLRFKAQVWEVLCSDYFQRWVRDTDTVVDLGAGTCEFINAIRCGEKIAVDINPETAEYARGAKVLLAPQAPTSERSTPDPLTSSSARTSSNTFPTGPSSCRASPNATASSGRAAGSS